MRKDITVFFATVAFLILIGMGAQNHKLAKDYGVIANHIEDITIQLVKGQAEDLVRDTQATLARHKLRKEVKTLKERLDAGYMGYVCDVTAYTADEAETDSTPDQTAIMRKPKSGRTVAVSRDLGAYLGSKIYIEGMGVYVVEDLMNRRFGTSVDIFVNSKKEALQFGRRKLVVVFLPE